MRMLQVIPSMILIEQFDRDRPHRGLVAVWCISFIVRDSGRTGGPRWGLSLAEFVPFGRLYGLNLAGFGLK